MKHRKFRCTAALAMLSFAATSLGLGQTTQTPGQQSTPTQQQSQPSAQSNNAADAQTNSGVATSDLPEAPQAQNANDTTPTIQQRPSTDSAQQNTSPTSNQEPLGAASAEKGKTRGGVASKPAGVAIAPAKQHRVRSIVIKTGAILAGAAAIGAVYALHNASPSRPPGATTTTAGAAH